MGALVEPELQYNDLSIPALHSVVYCTNVQTYQRVI